MSMRDSHVLHAVNILGEISLRTLAQGLLDAVIETEAEGITDPGRDPAVMAFGAFIAFHTHCDVATASNYLDAIERCAERHAQPVVMQ
jgi:hypothetical protein